MAEQPARAEQGREGLYIGTYIAMAYLGLGAFTRHFARSRHAEAFPRRLAWSGSVGAFPRRLTRSRCARHHRSRLARRWPPLVPEDCPPLAAHLLPASAHPQGPG
jgi:hypothetical protein